jgi:hypothetical protein
MLAPQWLAARRPRLPHTFAKLTNGYSSRGLPPITLEIFIPITIKTVLPRTMEVGQLAEKRPTKRPTKNFIVPLTYCFFVCNGEKRSASPAPMAFFHFFSSGYARRASGARLGLDGHGVAGPPTGYTRSIASPRPGSQLRFAQLNKL